MVLFDVEFKFFVASSDLSYDIVSLHFHMNFVDADEVKCSFDPNYRYSNAHLINHPLEFKVYLHTLPRHKMHWSFLEKSFALLLNLTFSDSSKVDITHNIMLVISVFLHFKQPCLLDLINFLNFFILKRT